MDDQRRLNTYEYSRKFENVSEILLTEFFSRVFPSPKFVSRPGNRTRWFYYFFFLSLFHSCITFVFFLSFILILSYCLILFFIHYWGNHLAWYVVATELEVRFIFKRIIISFFSFVVWFRFWFWFIVFLKPEIPKLWKAFSPWPSTEPCHWHEGRDSVCSVAKDPA